jgi:YHS domain-containing protein
MYTLRLFVLVTLMICLNQLSAFSQADVNKKHYNISKSGLAIDGYDPVAYFLTNKATKGNKDFAVMHQGVLYFFSSIKNKDLFKSNPQMYLPQYGGWCAYAMGSTGEKVEIDPETFKVKDGKLYLFYHSWTNNTLTKWNKDEVSLKMKADANWPKILDTKK